MGWRLIAPLKIIYNYVLGTGNGEKMQKIFYIFISIVTFLTIFITILSSENSAFILNKKEYYWPTPGYRRNIFLFWL